MLCTGLFQEDAISARRYMRTECMVKARIIEMIGECFRIEYQPEGQGVPGILLFDPENKKIEVEILAENDYAGSTFYTQPLYGNMMSQLKTGSLKQEFVSIFF